MTDLSSYHVCSNTLSGIAIIPIRK